MRVIVCSQFWQQQTLFLQLHKDNPGSVTKPTDSRHFQISNMDQLPFDTLNCTFATGIENEAIVSCPNLLYP